MISGGLDLKERQNWGKDESKYRLIYQFFILKIFLISIADMLIIIHQKIFLEGKVTNKVNWGTNIIYKNLNIQLVSLYEKLRTLSLSWFWWAKVQVSSWIWSSDGGITELIHIFVSERISKTPGEADEIKWSQRTPWRLRQDRHSHFLVCGIVAMVRNLRFISVCILSGWWIILQTNARMNGEEKINSL